MFSESLNDLIEKKRQGIGRAITQSTFNGIEDRGQNLLNFLRETNRQNLLLEAVDAGILENLVDWCLAKGWSNSFTRKVVNLAKQVVKNAVLNGDINHNRVSGFTHQADQPKYPEYLTKGQIAQLAAITFKEDERTLEKVRDAALFQCYTSFDYADLVQFDHSQHLYYDETGQAWLKKPRAKRQIKLKEGQEILVPITAELQSLLKKYDLHSPLHFPERKKHPYLSYNHYSLYLKALSKITGIDSLRKSKNLRKTFGMIQLNRGLTIESVSRMMGHQSIKITQQIYAKVDTSRLRNELQKFLQA
jgi:site-specific recombinase XerD